MKAIEIFLIRKNRKFYFQFNVVLELKAPAPHPQVGYNIALFIDPKIALLIIQSAFYVL